MRRLEREMNKGTATIAAACSPDPCGSDPPSGVRLAVRPEAVSAELLAFLQSEVPTAKVIAHRFGVSTDVAEDIRQETLLALAGTAEPIRSPRAWFWEVAHRRKLRIFRLEARSRKFSPALDVLARRRPSPFPAPEAAREQSDCRRALADFMDNVHPSRREVVRLHLLGHTESEIADDLNLPVGTVRSRLQRAKKEASEQWAALAALVAALWLWLVSSRGPSGEERGGGTGGRARNRGERGAGTRGPGGRLVACAACFVVPLVLAAHERPPPAGEAIVEEAAHVAPSDRWLPFLPFLTTNAEREREASSPSARPASPAAAASSGDGSTRRAARASSARDVEQSVPRVTESDREAAGRHLAAVHRAFFLQRDRQAARRLLDLYELTFANDPLPERRAALAAQLSAP